MRTKRFSIKTRVTIWYVCSLLLLVALLVGTLIYTSNQLVQNNVKNDLEAMVEGNTREVSVENGQLQIEDDLITYQDHIYLLVYLENHFIVTGDLPEGVTREIPFIPDQVRQVTDEGGKFYVYDHLISEPDFGDVWIRGITSASLSDSDPAITSMFRLFFIFLPLLILLAAIGGYILTRRAFAPIARITETATRITQERDLSQRIGLADEQNRTRDEIYRLSSVFDGMLAQLESAFEAEKQFSNDASHELRTPLAVIMTQCEYALQEGRTPEEIRAALEVIFGQSQKMSVLIRRLLLLARADRDAIRLEREELNVSELTAMAAMEQETAAAERQIRIETDIEPDILADVDESLFIRLWMNLIANSIKYGREGGFVRVTLTRADGCLRGEVTDNGIGIVPEDLPKIWDRFYQANPSRSDDGSAGLGLPIVQWIVTAHGGTISADSTPEQGSRFTFFLPLHAPAGENDPVREKEKGAGTAAEKAAGKE